MESGALSLFPPNFDGNPWSYGLALFADVLVSALSLAQLLAFLFEARRARAAAHRARHPISPPPFSRALNIYRMILSGLLLCIVARAAPDAVLLLAWGEATDVVMYRLALVDYWGDTFALGPFALSLFGLAWTAQAIPQKLAEAARTPLAKPAWHMMRKNLKIVGLVCVIALLVTIGKAHA